MRNPKIKKYVCLMAFVVAVCGLLGAVTVQSATQSVNVAIIGSPGVINGGTLPTAVSGITFTDLSPANVNTTNLAPFDTVVLNVASPEMACTTGTLSVQAKTDLVAFVDNGNKLIIYDSECPTADYTWLPFSFTTSNPGQMGATGTLIIKEENSLSSTDPLSPYYVDALAISTQTDAVGDANVMTTYNANWCQDMNATNYLMVNGPVHTYAKSPAGSDRGLIIYNGLDVDYLGYWDPPNGLGKIWELELKQPFNPSNLPCGYTVVGINLTPMSAVNEVGQDHTVTANLSELSGTPKPGIVVTFEVLSGPNAGASGTCSANSDCTTDASGNVSFTYAGTAGEGTDEIRACFTDMTGQHCSQIAKKQWVLPANTVPSCSDAYPSVSTIWPPNHEFVPIDVLGVTDPDGDPISITIDSIYQDEPVDTNGDGSFTPDGKGVGSPTAEVRAERSGSKKVPGNGRVYHIGFTAIDDKGGFCSGEVLVAVPHDQNKLPVDDGALYDSTMIGP